MSASIEFLRAHVSFLPDGIRQLILPSYFQATQALKSPDWTPSKDLPCWVFWGHLQVPWSRLDRSFGPAHAAQGCALVPLQPHGNTKNDIKNWVKLYCKAMGNMFGWFQCENPP